MSVYLLTLILKFIRHMTPAQPRIRVTLNQGSVHVSDLDCKRHIWCYKMVPRFLWKVVAEIRIVTTQILLHINSKPPTTALPQIPSHGYWQEVQKYRHSSFSIYIFNLLFHTDCPASYDTWRSYFQCKLMLWYKIWL